MDTVETVRAKLETKLKELEDLKKRIPRKCGELIQNIPPQVYLKMEELEEEIGKLRDTLKEVRG